MGALVSIALAGSMVAAGTGYSETRNGHQCTPATAIEDAQAILEQNHYLAPSSYRTGELDKETVAAISRFQAAHALSQTGTLNFDTNAELWSHAMAPGTELASSVVESPGYAYMPATIYRPTSETLFVENRPLILPGVEFDIDKATLRPESRTTLDQVTSSLKNYPDVMVEIQGHTSDPGTASHNMALSQRRADAVRDYFVSEGIDGSRLVATGYGETRLIAANDTAAGRQENRRVELHEIR